MRLNFASNWSKDGQASILITHMCRAQTRTPACSLSLLILSAVLIASWLSDVRKHQREPPACNMSLLEKWLPIAILANLCTSSLLMMTDRMRVRGRRKEISLSQSFWIRSSQSRSARRTLGWGLPSWHWVMASIRLRHWKTVLLSKCKSSVLVRWYKFSCPAK